VGIARRQIGTAIFGLIIMSVSAINLTHIVRDHINGSPEIRWFAEHGSKTTARIVKVYGRGYFGEKCYNTRISSGSRTCGKSNYVDLAWKMPTGEERSAEDVWFDYHTRVTVGIEQHGFESSGVIEPGLMLPILYDPARPAVAPILETELNAMQRWYGPYTIPVFTALYGLTFAFGVILLMAAAAHVQWLEPPD
jgi:hypothetical protein